MTHTYEDDTTKPIILYSNQERVWNPPTKQVRGPMQFQTDLTSSHSTPGNITMPSQSRHFVGDLNLRNLWVRAAFDINVFLNAPRELGPCNRNSTWEWKDEENLFVLSNA